MLYSGNNLDEYLVLASGTSVLKLYSVKSSNWPWL